jgi:hypothetical protein
MTITIPIWLLFVVGGAAVIVVAVLVSYIALTLDIMRKLGGR